MAHIESYSHITVASIPQDSWAQAWFSLSSWKGYLQSFPGFQAQRMSAAPLDNGDIRFHVTTVWEYREQLDEWANSQWSAPNLLRSINAYDLIEGSYEDLS